MVKMKTLSIASVGVAVLALGTACSAQAAILAMPDGSASQNQGVLSVLSIDSPADSQNVTIGLPPDPNNGNCFPFGCTGGTRYQQVYNKGLFSSPLLINEISFFNTQSNPGAGVIDTATYTLRLSTTTKAVNALDTVNFNSNVGADDSLFFSGILGGPIGGTKFTIPGADFLYDPSKGNLLLDIFKNGSSASGSVFLDARNGSFGSDSSRAHNFGTGFESYGLVTEFKTTSISVPEPNSTLGVLVFAAFGAGSLLKSKRQQKASDSSLN